MRVRHVIDRLRKGGWVVTIQCLLYAKEMTFKGKDGLTSILCNLTKASAWTDSEGNVSGTRASGSKG